MNPLLLRFLTDEFTGQPCSRRLGNWQTLCVLAAVAFLIAGAIAIRILRNGDVGDGACWALVAALVPMAMLAGAGLRKPTPPRVLTVKRRRAPKPA